MNVRTTIVLLGVLLALGIFVLVVELPSRKKEERVRAESKKVFLFDDDKVRECTLRNPGGEFVFVKGAQGKWRMVKPVDTEADQYSVNSLVNTMKNLSFERVLEEKPDDLSMYGLDMPRFRTSVTLEGGGKPLGLSVGNKSPLGSLYAKSDDRDRVLLVGSGADYTLNKKLFDLRERSVLSFDKDQVEKIIIEAPKKKAELVRKGGAWTLLSRVPLKANQEAVNTIISALSYLRVEEFVEDHPRGLAKYGLSPPWGRVGLILGADKSQIDVRIGSTAPKGTDVYATATGKDSVFLLRSEAKEAFEKDFDLLKDMRAFSIKDEDVNKFEIVRGGPGGTTLTLTKDPAGQWRIVQAFNLFAQYAGTQETLKNLVGVTFSKVMAEAPNDLVPYGLAKPSYTVRIWSKAHTDPQGLLIGKEKGKFLYAKRDGENVVYLVPDSILPAANKNMEDFLAPEEKASYEGRLKEQMGSGKSKGSR